MIAHLYMLVSAWLAQPSLLGGPRYMWALLTLLALAEYALGRSKNPRLRSLASAIATALDKLAIAMRVAMIPIVGPVIVTALNSLSAAPPPDPQAAAPPPKP